jgi:alpha-ketoglutarate-dependent taurine dioxygenase
MTATKELNIETLEKFLEVGKSFGRLIKSRVDGEYLDILTPKNQTTIKKSSLSKIYGTNRFPFHTDCAYLKTPPKYILLRYIGNIETPTPTEIKQLDFNKLNTKEIEFLKNTIWVVKGQKSNFYSKIYDNGILRYDENIMTLSSPTENLIKQILDKLETKIIQWTKNKTILINNWSSIHSRPLVPENEINNRILQRLNIAYE